MYVLVKAIVDHENTTTVSIVATSESLPEVQCIMADQHELEMGQPSMKWVDGWDAEYSSLLDMHASCDIETAEWSIHWHIFDTNNLYDSFDFI